MFHRLGQTSLNVNFEVYGSKGESSDAVFNVP